MPVNEYLGVMRSNDFPHRLRVHIHDLYAFFGLAVLAAITGQLGKSVALRDRFIQKCFLPVGGSNHGAEFLMRKIVRT